MIRVVSLLLGLGITVGLAGQEQPRHPRLAVVVVEQGTGLPLANVSLWITTANQDPRSVTTGGDGTATLYDLPPGNYHVHPTSPAHVPRGGERVAVNAGGLATLNLQMVRGGVIAGVIEEGDGRPAASARVTLITDTDSRVGPHPVISREKSTVTSADGAFEFAGLAANEYRVAANSQAEFSTFNEVYYPGTLEIERSEAVSVAVGDRRNLRFRLARVPRTGVKGVVVDTEVAHRRQLTVRRLDVDTGDVINLGLVDILRDGTFAVDLERGIHGFTYTVEEKMGPVKAAAYEIVHVGDEPTPPLNLRARPAASLSGTFVFKDAERPSDDRLAVTAWPVGPDADLRFSLAHSATIDTSFRVDSLFGTYWFSADTPRGWLPEAILLEDGRNVLHKEIEVVPGRHYAGVRVLLTNEVASISGAVPAASVPQSGASLMALAFPTDTSQWPYYGRNAAKTEVENDGRFKITDVRPDQEYFVTLCTWPCVTRQKDLEDLAQTAARIQVGRPGTYSVVLKR